MHRAREQPEKANAIRLRERTPMKWAESLSQQMLDRISNEVGKRVSFHTGRGPDLEIE